MRLRFDAAQERMGELYAGARKRVVAGAKCTDEAIRANPYQALAIALGSALPQDRLLDRQRKRHGRKAEQCRRQQAQSRFAPRAPLP